HVTDFVKGGTTSLYLESTTLGLSLLAIYNKKLRVSAIRADPQDIMEVVDPLVVANGPVVVGFVSVTVAVFVEPVATVSEWVALLELTVLD
uniref:PEX-1N domain-containing protein n=1 Tax=Steinernema glaseri TaxID=37863 RepID=A0A1I8AL73_9BILA